MEGKNVLLSSFDPNDTTFSVERLEHKYLSDIQSCESTTRSFHTYIVNPLTPETLLELFNDYRHVPSCWTSPCQKAIIFQKKNCEMIVFQMFCLARPIHQVDCDKRNARFTRLGTKSDRSPLPAFVQHFNFVVLQYLLSISR